MLYKFKSKASGDLIMLEPNGQRVLEIIGKGSANKGIILPEHMPAAIASLEAAVAREETERHAAEGDASAEGSAAHDGTAVGLRQRALPFIEMLKRCHKAGNEIVWGV